MGGAVFARSAIAPPKVSDSGSTMHSARPICIAMSTKNGAAGMVAGSGHATVTIGHITPSMAAPAITMNKIVVASSQTAVAPNDTLAAIASMRASSASEYGKPGIHAQPCRRASATLSDQ